MTFAIGEIGERYLISFSYQQLLLMRCGDDIVVFLNLHWFLSCTEQAGQYGKLHCDSSSSGEHTGCSSKFCYFQGGKTAACISQMTLLHSNVFKCNIWSQQAAKIAIDATWIDTRAKDIVDIVFVVDESGSVGPSNFNRCKDFMKNFLDYFSIAPGHSQVNFHSSYIHHSWLCGSWGYISLIHILLLTWSCYSL